MSLPTRNWIPCLKNSASYSIFKCIHKDELAGSTNNHSGTSSPVCPLILHFSTAPSHSCMTISSCWCGCHWQLATWDNHIPCTAHYSLGANLSQMLKLVIATFHGQRQRHANSKANKFAGTAGAHMDCYVYSVHKVWPNVHCHRIRSLHGRDLTLLYMAQELQVWKQEASKPAPTALSLNGINIRSRPLHI